MIRRTSLRPEHLPKMLLFSIAIAAASWDPPAVAAVSRSCGPDPIANTADVLCAAPSGPCNASTVTMSAGIDVTSGGCTFDLGGRDLSIENTLDMIGSGFIKVVNAGNITLTVSGKLKARGDFVQPQGFIIEGGLIELQSAGDILHDGVIDVTGDPAGILLLESQGDVILQGGSEIRGAGVSSFLEDGARFADGATVEILSGGGIVVDGEIDVSGQNAATGGFVAMRAANDIDVLKIIDASGGELGGGLVDVLAGDDLTITRRIDVSSRGGGGNGGTIVLAAGEDSIGGAVPNGTLMIDDVALKLEGSSASGLGGDGGELTATSTGDIEVSGASAAVLANAGNSWDGSGGTVSFAAGIDLTFDGSVAARSGGAGGSGGSLETSAGGNTLLAGTVDLAGKDSGGDFYGIAGGAFVLAGDVMAVASSGSGLGGEGVIDACDITIAAGGKLEVPGAANASSHPFVELIGRESITVSALAQVDAGASGEIVLRTTVVGGTCSNDTTIVCQTNADCTIGCNTGTCENINPDTEGTTSQFDPEPATIEDTSLPPCGAASQQAGSPPPGGGTSLQSDSIASRLAESGEVPVIVRLRDGQALAQPVARTAADKAALSRRQDEVLDALSPGSFTIRHRYERLNGFAGTVTAAGYAALRADPRVERVYLDVPMRPQLAEGRALVRADQAHVGGLTGTGITVAILDQGVDYLNSNLGGCFGPTCKVRAGFDWASNPNDPDPRAPFERHGTAVAGIVAADGAGTPPILGIAPDARLVSLRVCDQQGNCLTSDATAALEWVIMYHDDPDVDVQIVNMSFGLDPNDMVQQTEENDPSRFPCSDSLVADAIAELVNVEGVAVFAAAGNNRASDGILFPACVREAIAVGAVYDDDVGPYTSTFGNCTDPTTAPGQLTCYSNSDELLDITAPSNQCLTTAPGVDGVFNNFGGTSAASPYSAGVAALALQANPTLTPAQLRTALIASAQIFTRDLESGLRFPVIDALALATPPVGFCGDATTEPLLGEECDDGNGIPGDGCSPECQLTRTILPNDEAGCINALSKSLTALGKAQGRVNLKCITNGAKGKLTGTIEQCLLDDAGGKVANAEASTIANEADRCIGNPPSFGVSDATTINAAGVQAELDIVHDAFGPDLDLVIADDATDRETSRCQRAVATAVQKCRRVELGAYNKCAKTGLRRGLIQSATELKKCFGSSPRGRIAKVCDPTIGRIRRRIDTRCTSVDTSLAFPGCGTSDPAELAGCLERSLECHLCLTLDAATDLGGDCDLFDDLQTNGSCPVAP